MAKARRSLRRRPRPRSEISSEPLRSTQRRDGLWESIETDHDDVTLAHTPHPPPKDCVTSAPKHPRGAPPSVLPTEPDHLRVRRSIGTQTSPPPPPPPSPPPPRRTETSNVAASSSERAPTPTRADLIARVLHCPLPHPEFGLSPVPLAHVAAAEPHVPTYSPAETRTRTRTPTPTGSVPAPDEPTQGRQRRRRGRPRKVAAPFRNERRRVRFSDPALPEAEPDLCSRDSHVFVRLVRVVVLGLVDKRVPEGGVATTSSGPAQPPRREEFVWNNRAKGWKRASGTGAGAGCSGGAGGGGGGGSGGGRRRSGEQGLCELEGLFAQQATSKVALVQPIVLPTEGGGVRPPVEMAWDTARFCFQGVTLNGETVSITLGEMRDMAKDPWARQFVGYVMR